MIRNLPVLFVRPVVAAISVRKFLDFAWKDHAGDIKILKKGSSNEGIGISFSLILAIQYTDSIHEKLPRVNSGRRNFWGGR